MEVQIFGAARMVTGSCFGVHAGKQKILVDCGMFQGSKEIERMNYEDFGFKPKDYSFLLLTHAHLDHCGRIPKLVKEGFRGKIYCTDATRDLAYVVLTDAAKVAYNDNINENRRLAEEGLPQRQPIYTEADVDAAMKLFEVVEYETNVNVSDIFTAKFYDAGHILGACSIRLEVNDNGNKKVIAFSGDLGQESPLLVKDKVPIPDADYVFIECTYGDRLHPPIAERKQKLLEVITDTYHRGGMLMIPSFAIERTQELIYEINNFVEKALMPKMSVFIDSPMAINATEVFKKHAELYNDELIKLWESGDNPFTFPGLVYTPTVDDSKAINEERRPCIIIAGSGMCTAGRIKHHIKNRIGDSKSTLLFVGYQAEGTLGYWIKNGEKRIRLLGGMVDVNAKIEDIEGYSGHGDYNDLLNWLKHFSPKPKKVFLVHGEGGSLTSMAQKINEMSIENYAPKMSEKIVL